MSGAAFEVLRTPSVPKKVDTLFDLKIQLSTSGFAITCLRFMYIRANHLLQKLGKGLTTLVILLLSQSGLVLITLACVYNRQRTWKIDQVG